MAPKQVLKRPSSSAADEESATKKPATVLKKPSQPADEDAAEGNTRDYDKARAWKRLMATEGFAETNAQAIKAWNACKTQAEISAFLDKLVVATPSTTRFRAGKPELSYSVAAPAVITSFANSLSEKYEGSEATGYRYGVMLHQVFHGDEYAMKQCLDRGEVIKSSDNEGVEWFYFGSKKFGEKKTSSSGHAASSNKALEPEDAQQLIGLLSNLSFEMAPMKGAGGKAITSGGEKMLKLDAEGKSKVAEAVSGIKRVLKTADATTDILKKLTDSQSAKSLLTEIAALKTELVSELSTWTEIEWSGESQYATTKDFKLALTEVAKTVGNLIEKLRMAKTLK